MYSVNYPLILFNKGMKQDNCRECMKYRERNRKNIKLEGSCKKSIK